MVTALGDAGALLRLAFAYERIKVAANVVNHANRGLHLDDAVFVIRVGIQQRVNRCLPDVVQCPLECLVVAKALCELGVIYCHAMVQETLASVPSKPT